MRGGGCAGGGGVPPGKAGGTCGGILGEVWEVVLGELVLGLSPEFGTALPVLPLAKAGWGAFVFFISSNAGMGLTTAVPGCGST